MAKKSLSGIVFSLGILWGGTGWGSEEQTPSFPKMTVEEIHGH